MTPEKSARNRVRRAEFVSNIASSATKIGALLTQRPNPTTKEQT
jgi:hypothetical protein